MGLYYQDESVTLYHGDSRNTLKELQSGSADCIVTSPPYFGLRDYGNTGQIGAEESPTEYVSALVEVFREARRVLSDDGTLWLNLGDSYTGGGGGNYGSGKSVRSQGGQQVTNVRNRANAPQNGGLPPKNMLGIPWRVAFALQDDGWTLRNDIIWSKPNAMPESVRDRLSSRHEHVFMFTKAKQYWFNLDAIRVPAGSLHKTPKPGKNPGDVWEIATQPFPGAHFAVFPTELPRRCIAAGCKLGGVVLDPFSGSGTTGAAASESGRKYVGIDLNEEYLDLSLSARLQNRTLELG